MFLLYDAKIFEYNISEIITDHIGNRTEDLRRVQNSLPEIVPAVGDCIKIDETVTVYITETFHIPDKRMDCPKYKGARHKELSDIIYRGTISVSSLPNHANVLKGRFVLAINDVESRTPRHKAHFVVQGHFDYEKSLLVHQ